MSVMEYSSITPGVKIALYDPGRLLVKGNLMSGLGWMCSEETSMKEGNSTHTR